MDKNSFYNKVEDIKFPQGTKYEKELNLNFKYFNVLWYDPNKVNEFVKEGNTGVYAENTRPQDFIKLMT